MGPERDLERHLAEVERLCETGETERARREIDRAKRLFPEDLSLKELEADLLADEERFEESLALLDSILADHPMRYSSASRRCDVLMELGRFRDALDSLKALKDFPEIEQGREERAWIHFGKAGCLDRLDRAEEADREYRLAAILAPGEFGRPPRLSVPEFEALVEEALDSIPEKFDRYLRQVAVMVRDFPAPDQFDPFLLGLYVGVPRTARSQEVEDHLDRVFIFKRNLETFFPERDELCEQIRKTVIHEIAHHFGLAEEEMGDYA